MKTRYVTSVEQGETILPELVFPVEMKAPYSLGWKATANTADEFRTKLVEGLERSPLSEVELTCATTVQ